MLYGKGDLLYEGKTKRVYGVLTMPEKVVIQNKDDITANDDPRLTKRFGTKAISATATTCRMFELLKAAGIPVAYDSQLSATEFLSPLVRMIPLEVVGRRYGVGSYLKRHPELKKPDGEIPHRFHRLMVEFFLKTTGGKVALPDGKALDLALDPQKGEEDPLITIGQFGAENWYLQHSKKPLWVEGSCVGKVTQAFNLLGFTQDDMNQMEELLRRVFLVLEGAWSQLGMRLIDMKIEFGRLPDGTIVVADVIDNDSWRLRTDNWKEISKQVFRDGGDLAEIEENYRTVAELAERIRVPKQTIVLWKGSDKDEVGMFNRSLVQSVEICEITCSGHKAPQKALDQLEELMAEYPDGGVIIAEVGMSNGLGPILSARTTWPVIAVPLTAKEYPDDIWSSLRCPSEVPLVTVLSEKNAVMAALNILSASNPVAYMMRRLAIEDLAK